LRIAVALTASLSSIAELAVSDLSIDASAVSLSETIDLALKPRPNVSDDSLNSESESAGVSFLTITIRDRHPRGRDSCRERLYSTLISGELESENESDNMRACGALNVRPAELNRLIYSEKERA
jgi:hypothetical protein